VKPHQFHRQARAEYAEAARRYAAISPALGEQFYREIEQLIAEICERPRMFRQFEPPARRHFGFRFPVEVVFLDEPDQIWIVAVAGFKQSPGYWRERMPE
jgi:plasmid stabilization system protein ParE